ncbi:hypothetical protein [uncultured Bacteroides sp.]|uniref:hypothetical protein n=1 Tax=uncultured Bacteroides sp. TaxID=162156 RepID=UPI0025FB8DEC|nr:hypothetical protein [uncultured Bacteroides sp.]
MMKKFNHANIGLFALLTALLSLSSCSSDDDNYPKEYVGFEHSTSKVNCDKNETEKEIQIKIIAVKKSKEDRTVALTAPTVAPGRVEILKLTENKVTIKAGKKSATTIVKIFPQKMPLKQQNVTLSCIPQWKDGIGSKLSIQINRN